MTAIRKSKNLKLYSGVLFHEINVLVLLTFLIRTEASILAQSPIVGIGDDRSELESRKVATLALICELQQRSMVCARSLFNVFPY